MRLLVCTDGSAPSLPALSCGRWLAPLLNCPVMVLGAQEGDRPLLRRAVEQTAGRLAEHGLQVEVRFDRGRAERVISRAASAEKLTVLEPSQEPGRASTRGKPFRRLLGSVQTPLLFVPTAILPLEHSLVCSGGRECAETLTQVALRLARATGAQGTFLYFLQPSSDGSQGTPLANAPWQGALDDEGPEGRCLREALDWANALGVQANVRLRRGHPVHEILEEASDATYSLLGLGSRHGARGMRGRHHSDVTPEVAELGQAPMLVLRYGHPLEIGD